VTDGYVAPVNTIGFKTYKMPPVGKPEGCAAWSCDQFKGMWVYRTSWQLPRGFRCPHCKLQMFYLTGSRCWPPCNKAGACDKPVPFGHCGEPGQVYPEEFWNCADVSVAPAAAAARRMQDGGLEEGDARPERFPELGV
jgi:hypothetical protein